ncbi:hypothetical protein [Yinghuangia seranimata]|uniref:hypothetical protein n=1 Tax=Yinghuangia seranimata TaxID=408067 RepID=UPI00248B20C6|nr:hypothetical protein [Yinghuangia seranimata]MDI2127019.1 hypothetical protein [Yinghuangia seranimata]
MHPGPASPHGDAGRPGPPPGPGQAPPPSAPPAYDAPTQYGAPRPQAGYGAPAAPPPAPAYQPNGGSDGYPSQPDYGYPPQPGFGSPQPPYGDTPGPSGPPPRGARPRNTASDGLRGVVAFLCLLMAVLLAIPAVTASWLKNDLISDDGFADVSVKLIGKEEVRKEVQDLIADDVMRQTRLPQSTRTQVVQAVGQVMETDQFRTVWREGSAQAHSVVVDGLLGKDTATTQRKGDQLTIDVATPLDPLFNELAKAGVKVDRNQLPGHVQVSLAKIPEYGAAQDTLKGIDDAGWMIPGLAAGLVVAGLLIAVRRLRALALTAMGTLVAGGVLLITVNLARSPVLDEAAKSSTVSRGATGAVYDVFTETLVTYSWVVVIGSAVALAGAAVAGAVLRKRREAAF